MPAVFSLRKAARTRHGQPCRASERAAASFWHASVTVRASDISGYCARSRRLSACKTETHHVSGQGEQRKQGSAIPKVLYPANAHVTGGRENGHGRTADGQLEVDIRVPKELGGSGGGTNPEELFAV